jgi:hypothetical protein
MKRPFRFFILISSVIIFQPYIKCQDAVKLKRCSQPIEFDGKPFEEAWNGLGHFSLIGHQPNFMAKPADTTQVIITYDNKYLWIACRLFMNDPSKIVIYSKKRDEIGLFFDSFDITLDTYHDKENAVVFYSNPAALRADYTISYDGPPTPTWRNPDWNTFWDVKSSRDDKGWYLEMRIPFSSLRFKPKDNITTMGMMLRRFTAYNHSIDTYPALDPKLGTSKPSLGTPIEFENVQPSNPVYISPYVIGGNTRNWVLNDIGTKYRNDDTRELNAGLDLKYNINSNLTLDLTTNTDFAQVEADDQQVNLTRYSLYFPEKRIFFQERSSVFSFDLGGNSDIFYSRNIGLSEGQAVRIYGGARLVGRAGKWDIGLLDMQTKENGETPGENFGVARVRKQVINPNSFIGGIFTSRAGTNGHRNFAYGLDGIFRIFGNDYIDFKAAQTYDSDTAVNKFSSVDPMFLSAKWERRAERGFAYYLKYSYSGQKFNPGIGFVNMGSLQGFTGNITYARVPGRESRFFTITAYMNASRYLRLADGKLESFSVNPGGSLETKKGYKTSLSIEYQTEGVLRDFILTKGVSVLAGEYSFTNGNLSFQTPAGKHFSATITFSAGQYYDGQNYGMKVTPVFAISPSLKLSGSYQYNHILFPDREKKADIHIGSGRLTYMLSTKISASLFVQYASTTDNLISNFRFRFNPTEGNDLYLVVNDSRSISDEVYVPELPHYFSRTVLLKYVHTFRL